LIGTGFDAERVHGADSELWGNLTRTRLPLQARREVSGTVAPAPYFSR